MISGFLLVNKYSGISSSRVVQILKKKFNLSKVGHLGTLDPMATGLLIIAIKRATKFASLFLQSEKSYRAEFTLGIQTDTDDIEGEAISFKDVNINENEFCKIYPNNFFGYTKVIIDQPLIEDDTIQEERTPIREMLEKNMANLELPKRIGKSDLGTPKRTLSPRGPERP